MQKVRCYNLMCTTTVKKSAVLRNSGFHRFRGSLSYGILFRSICLPGTLSISYFRTTWGRECSRPRLGPAPVPSGPGGVEGHGQRHVCWPSSSWRGNAGAPGYSVFSTKAWAGEARSLPGWTIIIELLTLSLVVEGDSIVGLTLKWVKNGNIRGYWLWDIVFHRYAQCALLVAARGQSLWQVVVVQWSSRLRYCNLESSYPAKVSICCSQPYNHMWQVNQTSVPRRASTSEPRLSNFRPYESATHFKLSSWPDLLIRFPRWSLPRDGARI